VLHCIDHVYGRYTLPDRPTQSICPGDAPLLVLGRHHPGDHAFVAIDDDICCWNLQLHNLPQTGGFPESFEVNDNKAE
jgi:hypothetical protein